MKLAQTFGQFGGQYVPPLLVERLQELEQAFLRYKEDAAFKKELAKLLKDYVGRPSPLYFAERLSKQVGNKIYLKREDLNHTGAHKINNTLGQALLAKRMGRKTLIAETGAGQHGVATATAAALMGMDCIIFMGEVDVDKQKMNVYRMELLGAEVRVVKSGLKTLKEAVDEALMHYIEHPEVFYLLGSQVGPHPYPQIVRHFQKVIGEEAKKQILEQEGRLPDEIIACVGGGSNAIGIMSAFIDDKDVGLIGVEPAGKGLKTGKHAATLTLGSPGVIHGFRCMLLQDKDGNPSEVYSIASGLDYPGVSPEHSHLHETGRGEYVTVTDREALAAFHDVTRQEGIIPALETAHALAYLYKMKPEGKIVILNFSGRGDKDVDFVAKHR
ncbi:MAG: tryptophan synthase subunit beta [DPANN group archaeon]|nr:tryptophan synthase subunit beta [DPANN group archaeon]